MVTHVVIFTWRDDASAAQVAGFGPALDAMAAAMGVEVSHGPDLGFRDTNGDYALSVRFADRAAWDAYQAHPLHKAFLQDQVAPIVASRVAIQF